MQKMNDCNLHLFVRIPYCGRMFECLFSEELTMRENTNLLFEILKEEMPDLYMPSEALCIYDAESYQIIEPDILCRNLNLPQLIWIVIC